MSSSIGKCDTVVSLPPGFRFHPTDDELILHYLKNQAAGLPCPVRIAAEIDIYKLDPWDLPEKAVYGDREWYFFSPLDRKYPNGVRPNRAGLSGYWKATGTDRAVVTSQGKVKIGVKKTLVFYKGKNPKGAKTEWIMQEYRLANEDDDDDDSLSGRPKNNFGPFNSSMRLDDWVLCRIYKKSSQQFSVADTERSGDSVQSRMFRCSPEIPGAADSTGFPAVLHRDFDDDGNVIPANWLAEDSASSKRRRASNNGGFIYEGISEGSRRSTVGNQLDAMCQSALMQQLMMNLAVSLGLH
ncbi:NAC transcription factor 29-like [Zingiber officinale]|uniref:NAC domain-containing protein n=1 Tax=Zingiber officinale TaxID=94328 RepID=A0A8J5FCJ8_ZINOF|nr:NAC transcription factor 29-like [Zingiber officinale]KAG6484966.1 hypothetical protein ZIOFF_053491 [Zingiber officinale]